VFIKEIETNFTRNQRTGNVSFLVDRFTIAASSLCQTHINQNILQSGTHRLVREIARASTNIIIVAEFPFSDTAMEIVIFTAKHLTINNSINLQNFAQLLLNYSAILPANFFKIG